MKQKSPAMTREKHKGPALPPMQVRERLLEWYNKGVKVNGALVTFGDLDGIPEVILRFDAGPRWPEFSGVLWKCKDSFGIRRVFLPGAAVELQMRLMRALGPTLTWRRFDGEQITVHVVEETLDGESWLGFDRIRDDRVVQSSRIRVSGNIAAWRPDVLPSGAVLPAEDTEESKGLTQTEQVVLCEYQHAEKKLFEAGNKTVTDRMAYEYLRDMGKNDGDPPYAATVSFEAWYRQLAYARKKTHEHKHRPRRPEGRPRSCVRPDEV